VDGRGEEAFPPSDDSSIQASGLIARGPAAAERVPLGMSEAESFPLLFSPFVLRGKTLPSRVVFTAHTVSLSSDGVPGERAIGYYEARAADGVGMIVMEPIPVMDNGGVTPQNYRFDHPDFVAGLTQLTAAVHEHGTVFISQLYHMGANADPHQPSSERWGPSAMPGPGWSDAVRPIDEVDMAELVSAYANAAATVMRAGVDGVECMFAYDTLVDQFMDPKRNLRTDDFGGPLANRCRLAVMVLRAIRDVIGPDAVLGVTVTAAMQEYVEAVDYLALECDIDYVGVGNGNYESLHLTIPPMEVEVGIGIGPAAAVRRSTKVSAVIAEGRIRDAATAEKALATGACDLVGMTRALLADPEILRKSRSGHGAQVRTCIGYNLCIARRLRKYPVACVQNPTAGLEHLGDVRPAAAPHRVVVVGAGLAGLEAARVAAERGHEVLLLEASRSAGGQAALIAKLPKQGAFAELVAWRLSELARLGVDMRFNTAASVELILALLPGSVVVATGSRQRHLDSAISAAEVLSGSPLPDGPVIVLDSDGTRKGIGTAEWLAESGRAVTLVALTPTPAYMLDSSKVGPLAMTRIRELGVKLVDGHRLVSVGQGQVSLARIYDGTPLTLEAPAIVQAMSHVAVDELVRPLRAVGIVVHAVGDARTPRLVEDAIRDGYTIASKL
jgi:2,4-dienoyl-CoA reductase-like NADH-dependent reductase (Old Yellow Enzyme family)